MTKTYTQTLTVPNRFADDPEVTVTYEIIPGEFPIYHGRNANPGCDPDVDVISIIMEDGHDYPASKQDLDHIKARILEDHLLLYGE